MARDRADGGSAVARQLLTREECEALTDLYYFMHQDLYGDLAFPMQVVILLAAPERDFTGGAFLLGKAILWLSRSTIGRRRARGTARANLVVASAGFIRDTAHARDHFPRREVGCGPDRRAKA
ncbi:hypothetical protein CHELA1G11_14279 [Hyphomicrobiales bacterium]|nr:putative Proline hydroxylase [Hyphomicrobiales bacterium]CAH1677489.1 hypothetical protein CHELA1G11_14279 [Hyphomicrobiales bacterium]